jgi:hypothetical protein
VQKHERSECLNGLGVVLWRQHKRDEALEVWRRALDEDPANKIARKNLDKFTNEYNEPATLVGAFDDPNHFRTIQTELYLQQQGKTEFSTKEETMEVIGAILQAWNEHLAPRSKEIETMTAAEKTELFGGVRVDFARQFEPPVFKQPQTVETELSDDDRHVLELFDSMFPFLPPGTGIFLPGAMIALIALGIDKGRLKAIINGDEPSDDEEDLIMWAVDATAVLVDALDVEGTPQEIELTRRAMDILREELSDPEAGVVLLEIKKYLKEGQPPREDGTKRKSSREE